MTLILNIIGIDFEALSFSSKNYKTIPVEIGLYSALNNTSYTSIIKPATPENIKYNTWSKNNLPHLTKEIIEKATPENIVIYEINKFLITESINPLLLIMYGPNDLQWLNQLFDPYEKIFEFKIIKKIEMINYSSFFNEDGKYIIYVLDLLNIVMKKRPNLKQPRLINAFNSEFGSNFVQNHEALIDAIMAGLLGEKILG